MDGMLQESTELKPVKQSLTYDSSTGKMYAELGSSNNNNNTAAAALAQTSQPSNINR